MDKAQQKQNMELAALLVETTQVAASALAEALTKQNALVYEAHMFFLKCMADSGLDI